MDLDPTGSAQVIDDEAICELLQRHFGISNAKAHFQRDVSAAVSSGPSVSAPAASRASRPSPTSSQPSLEGFIALNRELLEMEREAEVQQAMEYTQMRSPESAQVWLV